MKIPMFSGGEYIDQVEAFLAEQGYVLNHPDYPVKVSNANLRTVWVRAEHHGSREGKAVVGGLWSTLVRELPDGWTAERSAFSDPHKADVFLVTLPEVAPLRTYDMKG